MLASSLLLGSALWVALSPTPPPEAARRQAIEVMNDGVRMARMANPRGAERALRRATVVDPGYAHAWLNLGQFYLKQERLADAEVAFRSGVAIEDDALSAELHHQLGRTILRISKGAKMTHRKRVARTKDALRHFEAAAKLEPRRAATYYGIGQCHEFLDEPESADQAYRRAIAVDPTAVAALTALGSMYVDYGFVDAGLAVLEANVQVNDTEFDAWFGLGRAYQSVGRPREAIGPFEKALTLEPGASHVYYWLGMAHAELRQRAKAVQRLEQFLQRAGPQTPAHVRRVAADTVEVMRDAP